MSDERPHRHPARECPHCEAAGELDRLSADLRAVGEAADKAWNQLHDLLDDEDLSDEKLRAASEGMLPAMADALGAALARPGVVAAMKREANGAPRPSP